MKTAATLQQKNQNVPGKSAAEKSAEPRKTLQLRIPAVSLAKPQDEPLESTAPSVTKSSVDISNPQNIALTTEATEKPKSQSARSGSGLRPMPGANKRSGKRLLS